jgi:hypothetical protein
MSSYDRCEQIVLNALAKLGYVLVTRQYPIYYSDQGRRPVFIDLELQREGETILVEVKCFNNPETVLADLYTTLGQYMFYRESVQVRNLNLPLYLAVPQSAYEYLSSESVVRNLWRNLGVHIIIINLETVEVLQWTN